MKINWLYFASSALVAGLLAASAGANAWYTRTPASICAFRTTSSGTLNLDPNGINNASATNILSVLCPIPDSNVAEKTTITSINVHVTDGNNDANLSVSSSACVHFFAFVGSECGTLVSTNTPNTFAGDTFLTPSADVFDARPFDFAFIHFNLPKMDGIVRSRVSGIAINGT